MNRFARNAFLLFVILSVFQLAGCGSPTADPAKAKKAPELGGPPPDGQTPHPLAGGGPEQAEKSGHGPGRGIVPEGVKHEKGSQKPQGSGPPSYPGGS